MNASRTFQVLHVTAFPSLSAHITFHSLRLISLFPLPPRVDTGALGFEGVMGLRQLSVALKQIDPRA